MPPRKLAHYEIDERLGKGGMGVVYRARDTRLGRNVAIKVLRAEISSDAHRRSRFFREARAAAALNHPHIATIYEIGEATASDARLSAPDLRAVEAPAKVLYIAMEHVEGRDLRSRLHEDGALPVTDAMRVAGQIAAALDAAHQAGVIHRDLKPGNVMLTPQGDAKLLDFGLAKILQPAAIDPESSDDAEGAVTRLTYDNMIMGTLPYISPEQLQCLEVDGRTDLFSLGVVVYEMLTGEIPYPGNTLVEYARALATPPVPASRLQVAVPEGLDGVLEKLLESDRDQRYRSAAELSSDLFQLTDTSAVWREGGLIVGDDGPSSLWRRWSRTALIAAAATFVAFVAIAAFFFGADDEPLYRNLAALPFEDATGDHTLAYLAEGLGVDLADRLRTVPGLNVTLLRALPDEPRSAGEIAAEAGAALVLTGEVEANDESDVGVTVELTEPGALEALWSRRFAGDANNIVDLQQSILRDVARRLTQSLSRQTRRRLSTPPTGDANAFRQYLRGRQAFADIDNQRHLPNAERFFELAVEADSNFALAWAGLSETLRRRHSENRQEEYLERAEQAAVNAVAAAPDLPEARIARANIYRAKGENEKAIGELSDVLALNPDLAQAHRDLARSYEALEDRARAAQSFERAIDIEPGYWLNHNQYGTFLVRRQDFAAAEAEFERAIELAPEQPWPYTNLALLRRRQGRPEAQLEVYERIPESALASDWKLATNVAIAYYDSGRFAEAVDYFESAARLNPRDPQMHFNLGDAYARVDAPAAAGAAYEHAHELLTQQVGSSPSDDERVRLLRYAAKARRCSTLEEEVAALPQHIAQTHRHQVGLARAMATCGYTRRALELIRQAIAAGHSPSALRGHEELAILRDDPEFRKLVPAAGG